MTPAAGDVDYAQHGIGYADHRRTDPRIEALVHAALGNARTVLNVGAGAGSYEPRDRYVLAVEPSAAMRAQRPAHLAPAIDAVAQALPFDDDAVDAAMAIVTIHQWTRPAAGLAEMRRVARGPVVILTFDPNAFHRLWLMTYAPELQAVEARRFPSIAEVTAALGSGTEVRTVPVPRDCVDGFGEAFYARPEALLDPAVRNAQSGWSFLDAGVEERVVLELRTDLESGAWDARWGALRTQAHFEGAVRLLIAPGGTPNAAA